MQQINHTMSKNNKINTKKQILTQLQAENQLPKPDEKDFLMLNISLLKTNLSPLHRINITTSQSAKTRYSISFGLFCCPLSIIPDIHR